MYLKCPRCLSNLIWGGDFDAEDYALEEEGIVSNFSCNCGVYAEVFYPYRKEVTKWIKYYIETEDPLK